MREITGQYLDDHRTERGSWSFVQMKALGVSWPPRSGWRAAIIGTFLTDEAAAAFETGRHVLSRSTLRTHAKQEIRGLKAAGAEVPHELVERARKAPPQEPTTPKAIRRAAKKARAKERKVQALAEKLKDAELAAKKGPASKVIDLTPVKSYPRADHARTYLVDGVDVRSKEFLMTGAWRELRYKTLVRYGASCQCCGASRADGAVMNVDHIKPRSLFPWLAVDPENLQVLCGPCNHGKSNKDTTDWRDSGRVEMEEGAAAHMRSIAGGW